MAPVVEPPTARLGHPFDVHFDPLKPISFIPWLSNGPNGPKGSSDYSNKNNNNNNNHNNNNKRRLHPRSSTRR